MGGMDMLRWMMCRMGECRIGMGTSSVYQPYIMALILSKVRDFRVLWRGHTRSTDLPIENTFTTG
jgi:hypothetical protein